MYFISDKPVKYNLIRFVSVKLEPPTSNQATPLAPAPSISLASSHLSSPFIPRAPIPGKRPLRHRSASPMRNGMRIDSPTNRNCTSPQRRETGSSLLEPAAEIVSTEVGGEIERIRQVMFENQLAQMKEAENRRPDYLKREKRVDVRADVDTINQRENDRNSAIGITDSPNKGRRLTLFQETSEESFEESLMAGGYGRYVRAKCHAINYLLILLDLEDNRVGSPTSTAHSCNSEYHRTFQSCSAS